MMWNTPASWSVEAGGSRERHSSEANVVVVAVVAENADAAVAVVDGDYVAAADVDFGVVAADAVATVPHSSGA